MLRFVGSTILFGSAVLACAAHGSVFSEAPRRANHTALEPQKTVHLEELWRFGGEDCDVLMGTITEATTDWAGNVYLLDTQLCHVLVLSPDGTYLRTISREGEGPGEVRRPRDIVCLPDSSIGLLELFPAKLVKLSILGEPRGTVVIGGREAREGGFTSAGRCAHRGGMLLIAGQRLTQGETGQHRSMYLASFDDAGEELVRFREATMTLDFNNLCFVEREMSPGFHLANAVGPAGRVFAAQAWDRYAIEVFTPEGELERVIQREFENRARTEDELRRVHALFDASDRTIPYDVDRQVEPSPPVISSLNVDGNGRLWVLHSRSDEHREDGVMQTYDVFDSSGSYLQQVSVACDGDPDTDALEFLDDGRVLLIKGSVIAGMARSDLGSVPLGEEEDAAPMEFICFRMP